ncbi:hypothetical protein SBD_1508 [Streptomyces bottropensis ATCC 25435]|uniref:Uncharacterized protein n=1 Tax=Streptomyces bottropensis ATCC 25435 TaxID=1054862 RepID=M3DJG1_9ACTN|nr:hypothetical protein SBD_1508 [Streptomyces bottropensis ATCC 25435]
MDKVGTSAAEAIADIPDGTPLAVGGFAVRPSPHRRMLRPPHHHRPRSPRRHPRRTPPGRTPPGVTCEHAAARTGGTSAGGRPELKLRTRAGAIHRDD